MSILDLGGGCRLAFGVSWSRRSLIKSFCLVFVCHSACLLVSACFCCCIYVPACCRRVRVSPRLWLVVLFSTCPVPSSTLRGLGRACPSVCQRACHASAKAPKIGRLLLMVSRKSAKKETNRKPAREPAVAAIPLSSGVHGASTTVLE